MRSASTGRTSETIESEAAKRGAIADKRAAARFTAEEISDPNTAAAAKVAASNDAAAAKTAAAE